MNVILENEITPKFNLLAEDISPIWETMVNKERVNDLESEINDRLDRIEAATETCKIAVLKNGGVFQLVELSSTSSEDDHITKRGDV